MDNINPQQQLWKAFHDKDIDEFSTALELGANPLETSNSDSSLFELIVLRYGYNKFVTACLKKGHIPSHKNQSLLYNAINYTHISGDVELIRYMFDQPVAVMFKYMTRRQCLDLMTQKNTFSDRVDHEGIPLIDINTTMESKDNSKQTIIHLLVGANQASVPDVTCDNIESFVEKFRNSNLAEVQKLVLLIKSIVIHKNQVFDFLMGHGVDYNGHLGNWNAVDLGECLTGDYCPLYFAVLCHNNYALQKLLKQKDLKTDSIKNPFFYTFFGTKKAGNRDDYRECVYTLLRSKQFDINEMHKLGFKVLHYAGERHRNEVVKELLDCGAYIGNENEAKEHRGLFTLLDISPDELRDYFDSCITSHKEWGTRYYHKINYQNLIPPESQFPREMPPLKAFANSEKHRYLLNHPVIESFLFYKWHQLSIMFYGNFMLYLLFAVSIMTFMTLKFGSKDVGTTTVTVFRTLSWIGIFYMVVREFFQVLTSCGKYIRSFTNYMELLMIILAVISCCDTTAVLDSNSQRSIAAFTLLLVALELFLLFGNLPVLSMSTHMLMLKVVGMSFIKSFALYSIFVVTFCLCFHILFGDGEIISVTGNKFVNPLNTVVKTIVMLTGELNADSFEFKSVGSYVIFLLFIFAMTMVLYNLLNGLAVNDIQAIRAEAQLNAVINRIIVLSRYEDLIHDNSKYFNGIFNSKIFQKLCHRLFNPCLNHKTCTVHIDPNTQECLGCNEKGVKKTYPQIDSRIIKKVMDVAGDRKRNEEADDNKSVTRLDDIEKQMKHMNNILQEIGSITNTVHEMFDLLRNSQNK